MLKHCLLCKGENANSYPFVKKKYTLPDKNRLLIDYEYFISCPVCGTYSMEEDLFLRLENDFNSREPIGISKDLFNNAHLLGEYVKLLHSEGKEPPIMTLDSVDHILELLHNILEYSPHKH